MPKLTARTRAARRQQILDAARRCFIRNGFQSTSMQDIFTEAGLSAGAVYSHFTGKDEIVTTIADNVLDEITSSLDGTLAAGAPSTLDEMLEQFFAVLQRDDIATIAITVWAEALRDPALRRRLTARYRRMRDNLTRLVLTQQQSGAIDPRTPASQVAQVLTSLGPAFLHQRAFDSTVTAASFARGLKALRSKEA
jgi:AcrR family transcriptional regulator